MSKSKVLIIAISWLLIFSSYSSAYDHKITHRTITEQAAFSAQDTVEVYLKTNLGIANGYDQKLNDKKIIEWLSDGSQEEDEPNCRAGS